jgi:hypothetical protein
MSACLAAGCTGGGASCPVGDLADSHYCGDDGVSCPTRASLSEGCMGSHTEQTCEQDRQEWIRIGGDDAADLFYDGDTLAAVRRIGEGDTEACPDSWFGLDLSACAPIGEPVPVYCDAQGE